jgi:hypothetical protein
MATAGDSEMRSSATPGGLAGLLDELRWRGMLHQYSNGLAERLATGETIKGYNGFDPTGFSLHIGGAAADDDHRNAARSLQVDQAEDGDQP